MQANVVLFIYQANYDNLVCEDTCTEVHLQKYMQTFIFETGLKTCQWKFTASFRHNLS